MVRKVHAFLFDSFGLETHALALIPGQSKSGTGFLVRINTLELRGASTSATLQLSHSDDFGELRHKVAAKVSRVHDAPFIVVAVVVQGYQAANVMLNANTQRHANLTASSGLFNSNLNHLPLDTENVSLVGRSFF
jgi:hypothetical protein